MPHRSVFVSGASGFIGEEVAFGFRRAGYHVFGLVRTQEKADKLAFNEITPVLGDLMKPETYADTQTVQDCYTLCCRLRVTSTLSFVSIVTSNFEAFDKHCVSTFLAILTASSSPTDPAVLVYTSGLLNYKGMNSPADAPIEEDNWPLEEGHALFNPRVVSERNVLQAYQKTNGKVAGVTVRPSYVYGRKSGHFYPYFEQAVDKGEVVVLGRPDIIWSEVHIDDLVDGYLHIAAAKTAAIGGQAFNFADSSRNTNLEIATAFARAAGYTGEIRTQAIKPDDIFEIVTQKTVICSGKKAEEVLGWKPRKKPMIEEVDVMWRRWQAARKVSLVKK
ncbi:hypothetical protein BC936DRAFT_140349 [Jimgerdemannia flammicorona]|uniref:3-beta hydroxysteroid dehydrogenase/isomerase domain-containing protein n=1 Tax=Jimgerdemannia flammicorona TaxID=994334 RepID=A0A433AUL7_9FUNG|nr:hypothetical protein BC936DRAFT_140349 [Jimgerdemannia flammicorona]